MGAKLFRSSFFGFNKQDVNAYLATVSDGFNKDAKNKDDQIKSLENRLKRAEEELEKLRQTNEEFENSKESISRAIIKAEEKAAIIIEDAKRTAVEEKFKVQNETLEEAAKLRKLKQETDNLRRSVISMINRFSAELEPHCEKGGE